MLRTFITKSAQEAHSERVHSRGMNTNSARTRSTGFSSIRSLGRGIAVSASIALLGIGSISAADASAAGVSTGVRHTSTATSTTDAAATTTSAATQYALRDGKFVRVEG